MAKKEEGNEARQETSEGSFRSESPTWISPSQRDRLELEKILRRELALKHKFGELYRSKHDEEVLGIIRDPDTPPQIKQLVIYYANMWGQLYQVFDEIEENEKDIKRAQEDKEPLLEVKYKQYKDILEKNKKLRINRLLTDKKILHASRLFPQGIELIPEKEYRDLGLGKVFVGSAPTSRRRRTSETSEDKEESGIA